MKATDLLRKDHQRALQLMDQLLAAGRGAQGKNPKHTEVFNDLQEALIKHAQIEEQEFYPLLKSIDETRDWVNEAMQEHQQVEETLRQLASKSPELEDFQTLLEQLRSDVMQHVDMEENQIFPTIESAIDEQHLKDMAGRMQKMQLGKAESTSAASMRKRMH